MSDYQQMPLPFSHLNNGLFADYYLNEIVPTLPEWDESLFHAGKQALEQLRTLRAEVNPAALDEAQLEERWVKPVLEVLEHHFAVQVKLRYRERGHRKPDYVFFASPEDTRAVTSEIYGTAEIAHAIAVGDAKRWGANLDQTTQAQRNPSQQIDEYLRYSELPWGILTDGRIWRLYHRDTSKYNTYYAVDLEQLLQGTPETFLYFYAFFRRQAFTEGWLIKVLSGSEDFAQKLTDKLEGEVYDALEMIAQGFLDYRRNRLKADHATLQDIYKHSLVLLYRLLFIFYAESREILPLRQNKEYTDQRSLNAIKRDAAAAIDRNQPLHPDSDSFYSRLKHLFFVIDEGDSRLDMPPYNGHLFSDKIHAFLSNNAVGDSHLVPALDKLARVVVQEGSRTRRVFVDYRDLEVRHLGSIYEKLLEYELDAAAEPLTIRGKEQRYAPAKEDDAVVKQPGDVFLRTGNNERKVTGSYYTPDYIVRFIVEKTLEPLLTEITSQYAELDQEGHWQVHDPEGVVRAILGLNVLDPATGSGHFVVDVTAYIAEWLRDLGLRMSDIGEEDELIYWKRQVASACIYAVDINPLAVELAKLSMWLTTLAKGRPLSFLDHHIRVGNSLVGTSVFDMQDQAVSVKEEDRRRKSLERQRQYNEQVGQLTLFSEDDFTAGVKFAVAQMHEIEATIADHVRDVKRQEELYAALTQRLSSQQQAADVWTARYFGLSLTDEQWKAVRQLTPGGMTSSAVQEIVDEAERIAHEQRFFHWELVFPEIFFDETGRLKENAGFDAVVGNPPYVRMEEFKEEKKYYSARFETYQGTADLFVYFFELSFHLLKKGGRQSYITSSSWIYANYATSLRAYMKEQVTLESLIDLGDNRIFRDALDVYPAISVFSNVEPPSQGYNASVVTFSRSDNVSLSSEVLDAMSITVSIEDQQDQGWRLDPIQIRDLTKKITSTGQPLRNIVEERMYRGILTGYNDAFLVDESKYNELIRQDAKSAEVLKPIISGADVRSWYSIESKQFLVWAYQGIQIDNYPAIKQHLEQYREALGRRWEPSKGICEWYDRLK